MKKLIAQLTALAVISIVSTQPATACTDFRLTAKDGTLLITRSMEFGMDMKANVRSSNRGRQFNAPAPAGKPGLAWKAKYGYLLIDGLGQDVAFDGMNEAGLSFEYLYLPGETQYQIVPTGKEGQALPYYLFGDWVLSSFKTIDEVKQALANIYVYAGTLPGMGEMILPAHASIYDTSGKGIVIEFVGGKVNIYDSIGITTNSPTYDSQVTNLRNLLNLSPYSPRPITANGIVYSATGQGAGMVGLPGDVSPTSRFAKTAFLATAAYPAADAAGVLNLGVHIINNVDIPAGLARSLDNGKESSDITQWVVFKDLTHKILYYRTYNDMTLRKIDMSKVNFSEKATRLQMPMANQPYVSDVTISFTSRK